MAVLSPDSLYLFPSEKTGGRLTERALRHLVQKYMHVARLEGVSAHDLRYPNLKKIQTFLQKPWILEKGLDFFLKD